MLRTLASATELEVGPSDAGCSICWPFHVFERCRELEQGRAGSLAGTGCIDSDTFDEARSVVQPDCGPGVEIGFPPLGGSFVERVGTTSV